MLKFGERTAFPRTIFCFIWFLEAKERNASKILECQLKPLQPMRPCTDAASVGVHWYTMRKQSGGVVGPWCSGTAWWVLQADFATRWQQGLSLPVTVCSHCTGVPVHTRRILLPGLPTRSRFCSTSAPLRVIVSGVRDQTAQVELNKGTIVRPWLAWTEFGELFAFGRGRAEQILPATSSNAFRIRISLGKPSLWVSETLKALIWLGRESGLLRCDWLDFLACFAPILKVDVYGS